MKDVHRVDVIVTDDLQVEGVGDGHSAEAAVTAGGQIEFRCIRRVMEKKRQRKSVSLAR